MAGLLPSTPDVDQSDEPRVVGLDSDDADELIDALSSITTRRILAALHEEPASASTVADRVDTSLQNTQYHLRKLEDAGLVEVGDTVYSEKGREMDVYVPADRALVVVAGREEETTGLKAALSRLLGGIGVLGVASLVVDRLARRERSVGFGATTGAGGGGDGGAGDVTETPEAQLSGDATGDAAGTPTPTQTTTTTATGDDGATVAEATTTTTGPTEAATVTDTPAATATPTEVVTETATAAPTMTQTATPTRTAVPVEAVETTTTAAQPGLFDGLAASPGLFFFLGGSTMLLFGFAVWWLRWS